MSIRVFSTVLLLTVISCAKTEISNSREITLSAFSQNMTKVVENPIETFGLFANYTDEPDGTPCDAAWEASVDNYLNNKCFAKVGSQTVYVNVNPQNITEHQPIYWPGGGSLMFAAYSPHDSQASNITLHGFHRYQDPHKPQSFLEIEVMLKDTQLQETDLLYADTKFINNNKSIANTTQEVHLPFKHAQTKLTFHVTNPEQQFMLTAKLKNCINHAIFYSGADIGWKPLFETTQKALNPQLYLDRILFNNKELGNNPSTAEIIVIPQQVNGDYIAQGLGYQAERVQLVLELTEKDQYGSQTLTYNMEDFTKTWEKGKHYIYNITIRAHQIEFETPIIDENWEKEVQ